MANNPMITPFDARILIVDDQESNVLLLQNILKDGGYKHFETTRDSRQVSSLVNEFRPDLILLDLMMPHLDGYAVMEQLRPVIPPDTYLPILVLTADATRQAKQRALSLGAKDFLTKPLDQVEVLLRIKNLLETRLLHLQQQRQNLILEDKVRERTVQIQRQLQRLSALRMIDTAISSTFDLKVTLNFLLEHVTLQLGVDAAAVLLLDRDIQELRFSAEHGFRGTAITSVRLRLGEDYAGRAALERRSIHLPNIVLAEPPFANRGLMEEEGFVAYYAVPLVAKGQVKGVLEIFHRSTLDPDSDWTDFLETLAGQTAIAVDNAELFEDLQQSNAEMQMAYDRTIEGWSRAMDLRDKETEGHTLRVSEMTLELCRKMHIKESELAHIRRGALLHDMGKLGIPDSILLKPAKLTDEEWVVMRKHPTYAYEMLSPIAYLKPALDIPYCHHEKWDGTGYPRGLKGEQIPFAARIFAVVDVWDALHSDRPYRPAWPKDKVREYVSSLSGTHFDPQVVDVFIQKLDET